MLGLTQPGYEPARWEPVDTLAFLELMAWDLRSNLDEEIERAVLAQELGQQRAAQLYPPYDDAPVIVRRWGPAAGAGDALEGIDWDVATPLLQRVGERVAQIPGLAPPGSDGLGSNSWVVAGEHTASGAPLLANDPHLGIQMPSIWHQSTLRCTPQAPESECGLNVSGFTFPGVPGIVVGHNADVAWGVTNTGADVMDLYVEGIHPEDPTTYRADGEWVDMEVTTETLRSADGTTEELTVRRTRNGPIISDPLAGRDYPYWLGADWACGQRAERITELLRGDQGPLTLADVRRQQVDARHPAAAWLVPAVTSSAVEDVAADGGMDPARAGRVAAALEGGPSHDGRLGRGGRLRGHVAPPARRDVR